MTMHDNRDQAYFEEEWRRIGAAPWPIWPTSPSGSSAPSSARPWSARATVAPRATRLPIPTLAARAAAARSSRFMGTFQRRAAAAIGSWKRGGTKLGSRWCTRP